MIRNFLLLIVIFSSCNKRVVSYLNSKSQFENFASYQLVNVKINKRNLSPEATALLGTVESFIKAEMEDRRGYVFSNVNPDLILRYELVSNSRTESTNNTNTFLVAPSFRTSVVYESVILVELCLLYTSDAADD